MSDAKQWADELEFALSDEMFPAGSTMQMNPDVIRDGVRIMRQLEEELAESKAYADKPVDGIPYLPKDIEVLIDALNHCGYDPDDCIDCGGPPHNEWCRFWKVRHLLSYWEGE